MLFFGWLLFIDSWLHRLDSHRTLDFALQEAEEVEDRRDPFGSYY